MSDNKKPKIEAKESIKIPDRGIKTNITGLIKDRDRWRMISIILVVAVMITSTNFVFGLLGIKSRVYVQTTQGATVELRELPRIPLNETRIAAFLDEANPAVLALNFSTMKEQLTAAKKYFLDQSFERVIGELKSSNYLKNVSDNKLIISMVPVSDFYKVKVVAKTKEKYTIDVQRSYLVNEASGDNVIKRYYIVSTRIEDTNNFELYPWGMYIQSFVMKKYTPTDFKMAVDSLMKTE